MKWRADSDGDFFKAKGNVAYDELPAGRYKMIAGMMEPYLKLVKPAMDRSEIIPGTVAEQVVGEVQRFVTMKDRYETTGLTYKRGILLHGVPGCGKTTALNQVCGMLTEDTIGAIVLDGGLSEVIHGYRLVRELEPDRLIVVLLEDLDRYASNAAFVDFLDGGHGAHNVVFLGTTNYLDRLPERIKNRPSRFDTVVKVSPPTDDTRRTYLERMGCDEAITAEIIRRSSGLSFAHLKEMFIATMLFEQTVEEALRRIKQPVLTVTDKDGPGIPAFGVSDDDEEVTNIGSN